MKAIRRRMKIKAAQAFYRWRNLPITSIGKPNAASEYASGVVVVGSSNQ